MQQKKAAPDASCVATKSALHPIEELYTRWHGTPPTLSERLAGAGSNRTYYRLTDADGHTVIGCEGTSREENEAFIYLSAHFAQRQLPVPRVLAVSDDHICYLQDDLGSTSLFDALRRGREAGGCYADEERCLLRATLRQLPRLQFIGAVGLDFNRCYPKAAFDREGIFFDLNYFKYCFLKATATDFNEVLLERDFCTLAEDLLKEDSPSPTFLYRDFQARNVMLCPNPPSKLGNGIVALSKSEGVASTCADGGPFPCFIDFQGGRRGPLYYDLASFLWQASARYPDDLRRELIDEYYAAAQTVLCGEGSSLGLSLPPRSLFDSRLRLFVLFRTLQVLGAYGFRGYFERKQHFIDSILPALDNVRQLLADGACPYPYLHVVLTGLTASAQLTTTVVGHASERADAVVGHASERANTVVGHASERANEAKKPLVVKVYSFSYKKGIPADDSGNGGGYVFDCRYIHNPGRYDAYKKLTGLDQPVIQFLEDNGEIITFLDSVYRLADAHVARYLERGFTSLMFAFGCTGGQHRSVYSAQHLADHLRHKFPNVEVRLQHRELALR